MRSARSASNGNAGVAGFLAAAACALAPAAAAFETDIWPGGLPASNANITVNWSEVGLIEGLPDTVGGWVLIDYGRSVACSPPRACYANAQRVYVLAFCRIGAIKDMQRISMDLNGNAVAQTGERVAYVPSVGSVDRAVMRTLCGAYGFYHRPWGAERDED